MKIRTIIFFSLLVLIADLTSAQTIKYEFVKNCLIYTETEVIADLTARNFNFVTKDYVNLGDVLINRSDYYTSKKPNSNDTAEIAVFINKRKNSKKSVVFSFVETKAFANYNELEARVQASLTKEPGFKSDKFDEEVSKYSYEKNFYYFFKNDFIWYIIVSNFPLEEYYFTIKSK